MIFFTVIDIFGPALDPPGVRLANKAWKSLVFLVIVSGDRSGSRGYYLSALPGLWLFPGVFSRVKPWQFPVDHRQLGEVLVNKAVPVEFTGPGVAHPEFTSDPGRHRQGAEDLKIFTEKFFPQIVFAR